MKEYRMFVALVIAMIGGSYDLGAQTATFRHFGVEQGLPSVEVYDAHQDRKGFIWFATDNGVVRYDGEEMRTFQGRDRLPDPVVFGFYEDVENRLWFRSYSGLLSWYKNDSITPYPFNDTIAKLCFNSLLRNLSIDSVGQLEFTTNNATGRITRDGRVIHELPSPKSPGYWKNFHDCSTEWRGKKYVSIENILFEIRDNRLIQVLKARDVIISLSTDKNQTLWIGYLHYPVERFSSPAFSNPTTPDFLRDQLVTRVIQDREDGYWITTLKNGVYYLPDLDFKRHEITSIRDLKIAVKMDQHVLVGDADGSLTLIRTSDCSVKKSIRLKGETLIDGYADSHGQYWISSGARLNVFDSTLSLKHIVPHYLRGFFEDSLRQMWGFDNARIMKLDRQANTNEVIFLNAIHRSILRSDPYVIMAARTGFDVYDRKFKLVASPAEFKGYKVSNISNLNDSIILVSTIGSGFFVVSKKTWAPIQPVRNESSIGHNIYACVIVESMVWLGTEKGVVITSTSSLINGTPSFNFLTAKGGLSGDKVNQILRVNDEVWIFSGNSFTIVPADVRKFARSSTVFYLKDVRVNNVNHNLRLQPELAAGENNLQINFGFIDFKSNSISVRTRLNQQSAWNYTTLRTLSFNRLAPGDYHLEIEYSVDGHHWSRGDSFIHFSVAAPWWQSWIFQISIVLVILIIGFAIVRSRIDALRRRNQHLRALNDHKQQLIQAEIETMERERSRIAKDLHDGAGMNLTVLKLKINQAFKNQPGSAPREITKDLDATIQDIRDLIYNLTPSGIYRNGLSDSLENYIQRNLSDVDIKIDIFASGFKITDEKISLICFRILQELINNSVKHSGASLISIELNAFHNELSILYQDNGRGFDITKVNPGAGLLNIESRLGLIDGRMSFSSSEFGVTYAFTIPYSNLSKHDTII